MVLRIYAALLCCVLAVSCVDPVSPEFEYKEGLIYIEALASNAPGASYVNITRSAREFGFNTNKFVGQARVAFVNSHSGLEIDLIEDNELYLPPASFAAAIGETWELRVVLEDGSVYKSEAETIQQPVAITDLEVTYKPELRFEETLGFIPGHQIEVSFNDPANTDNYYYWRYRSFERLINCRACFNSVLREGECIVVNQDADDSPLLDYYTYACEEHCWRIRYSDKIIIFSDEFSNGATTRDLLVAEIPLFAKGNILIELQQFSLSPTAYRYYKTLKDIIGNNTGFNSPLPAALVGNLYNPSVPDEFVLGRFTAAPTSVRPIFIERLFVEEDPLEDDYTTQPEGNEAPPVQIFSTPCEEGRFRTSRRPEAWID